jgi:hypothetical protein
VRLLQTTTQETGYEKVALFPKAGPAPKREEVNDGDS